MTRDQVFEIAAVNLAFAANTDDSHLADAKVRIAYAYLALADAMK